MNLPVPGPYPLRIAVGLGAAEREQALLPALTASGDIVVTARCLAAEQLLDVARGGQIDVVLAAHDLHRLSPTMLAELVRTKMPLVLLVPEPNDEPWASLPGAMLPLDAGAGAVSEALSGLARGGPPADHERKRARADANGQSGGPERRAAFVGTPVEGTTVPTDEHAIITVGGGPGSPGRTTVALNLAVALGAKEPTVLLDADLAHPSISAWLDLDVTRNLSMLAHSEPATSGEWDRALGQEIQPLDQSSPFGVVLCGVPKPEMRSGISGQFFERLLTELNRRYRYVIVDIGVEVTGTEGAMHRTGLARAQRVLLVTSADLLGLHGARTALGLWQTYAGLRPEQLALVINKHDPRYHHSRAEIEWSLRMPAAAVVPYDHRSLQRALAAQRPVLLKHSSRAAGALLDLATRLHGGKIALSPAPAPPRRNRWLSWLPLPAGSPPQPDMPSTMKKGTAAHDPIPVVSERSYSRSHRSRGGARAQGGGAGGRR